MPDAESLANLLAAHGFQVLRLRKPRIREMHDFEVLYQGRHLAYIRVFEGRPPYYRGWVEVYGVDWGLARTRGLERALLQALASVMEPGETLFIEYVGDRETERELEKGTPPEATRLGRLLLSHGFAGLEDMYYPEGFMEGGPKLRARYTGATRPRPRGSGNGY